MTAYLSLEDLLGLAHDLGVGPVCDVGLLDSAAYRPQSVVFGTEVYPTLDDKAAVLVHSIVGNHPLVDGNKRLGWLAVVVFYGVNGIRLDVPNDDAAYELVIAVAKGEVDPVAIAERLASWR
ncbi:MAG: type II toxin-antitoxin system death-on-curing family toxin [Dermatophilaceae bacterium]